MDFYERFIKLCAEKGIKPSPMLESIGIKKTAASNWKKRQTAPTACNLQKIADYFDVSVEYLKGETDEKKKPSADNGEELTNEKRLLLALFDQIPKEKQAEAINRMIEVLNNP